MTTITRIEDVQFSTDFKIGEPGLRGRTAPTSDKIVADACRRFPGQAAVLPLEGRKAASMVITVNQLGSLAFPKGQFRASQSKGVVYVAYVGKKK